MVLSRLDAPEVLTYGELELTLEAQHETTLMSSSLEGRHVGEFVVGVGCLIGYLVICVGVA